LESRRLLDSEGQEQEELYDPQGKLVQERFYDQAQLQEVWNLEYLDNRLQSRRITDAQGDLLREDQIRYDSRGRLRRIESRLTSETRIQVWIQGQQGLAEEWITRDDFLQNRVMGSGGEVLVLGSYEGETLVSELRQTFRQGQINEQRESLNTQERELRRFFNEQGKIQRLEEWQAGRFVQETLSFYRDERLDYQLIRGGGRRVRREFLYDDQGRLVQEDTLAQGQLEGRILYPRENERVEEIYVAGNGFLEVSEFFGVEQESLVSEAYSSRRRLMEGYLW